MRPGSLKGQRNEEIKLFSSRRAEMLDRGKWFCFGLAWINAKYPSKPLYHSPSSTAHRREEI